ncbi:hypothetical protein ABPG74_002525 [Tetrahymena malaccensis]
MKKTKLFNDVLFKNNSVIRRIKSSIVSTKQIVNFNGYITSGPLLQNKQLMRVRGKHFLVAISLAFLLINFIYSHQSLLVSFIGDEIISPAAKNIDIGSFSLYCNMSNILIPLLLGYLSDYISIGYLLMITLVANFFSNIMLSIFLIYGGVQQYLLMQILWQIANEGIQNACFNLLYEYSNITKQQTVYYSIFTIVGYCIPRSIPLISDLFLSQKNTDYIEQALSHKNYYAYFYIILNIISTSFLLYVVRKNHRKELEEFLLDMKYYMVRISPAQKPDFFQAVKKIIFQNKHLMKQFFFSAVLVGISSVLMSPKFYSCVLQMKDIEFTYEPYMFSKLCQITSGLLLLPFGKKVDQSQSELFKLKIFQACFIVIAIIYSLLQILRFIDNSYVIKIYLGIFACLLGICYYFNFMTIMGTIYLKSGYLSRGMGFGVFSCCYNLANTITQYILYYLNFDNIFNFSIILFFIAVLVGLLHFYYQIKNNSEDQNANSQLGSFDVSSNRPSNTSN